MSNSRIRMAVKGAAAAAVALGMTAGNAMSVSLPAPVTPVTAAKLGFAQSSTNCGGGPATGSQSWVLGPVAGVTGQPIGLGSYKLTTGPDGASLERLLQPLFATTKLGDLLDLRYSTFVEAATGLQAPRIVLSIDNNGDVTRDDVLTFEPQYQNGSFGTVSPSANVPNQGNVVKGTWQHWNALPGGWVSDNESGPLPRLHTIASYLAAHPKARIVNSGGTGIALAGVQVTAGCASGAWDDFVGYIDALTIATRRATVGATVADVTIPNDVEDITVDGTTVEDEPVGAGFTYDFETTP